MYEIVPGSNQRPLIVQYRGVKIHLSQGADLWKSSFQINDSKRRKCYGPTQSAAQQAAEEVIARELDRNSARTGSSEVSSKKTEISKRLSRRWSILVTVVVLVACLAVTLFVGLTPSFNTFDYPIAVANAARTLHGEKPYVDFEVYYGPLSPYIAAAGTGAMSLFFPLIPAFNFFCVVCAALYLGYLCWKLVDLPSRRIGEYIALILYIILLTPIIAHYAYYTLIPAAMVIAAIESSRKVFDPTVSPKLPTIFLLSVIAVVTLFSRFNFGVFIYFAIAVVGLYSLIVHRAKNWKVLATLAGVIGGLMGVAFLLLYLSGILFTFIHDLIVFLPRYGARRLPLPYDSVQVILLFIVFAILLVSLVDLALRKRFGAGALGIIIALCIYQYTLERYDMEHAYPLLLLFPAVYLAIERDNRDQDAITERALPRWLGGSLAGIMLLLAVSFSDPMTQILDTTTTYWRLCLNSDRSLLDDTVLILPNEVRMLNELAANPDTNTEIFWGSMPGCAESTTQIGANLCMYLAQHRLPVTKIWTFDPSTTAHDDIQQILISEIEAKQIKCIAMQGLIDPSIGYLPGNPPESKSFYNYVIANYTFIKRYMMPEANRYYDIYVKKPAARK